MLNKSYLTPSVDQNPISKFCQHVHVWVLGIPEKWYAMEVKKSIPKKGRTRTFQLKMYKLAMVKLCFFSGTMDWVQSRKTEKLFPLICGQEVFFSLEQKKPAKHNRKVMPSFPQKILAQYCKKKNTFFHCVWKLSAVEVNYSTIFRHEKRPFSLRKMSVELLSCRWTQKRKKWHRRRLLKCRLLHRN